MHTKEGTAEKEAVQKQIAAMMAHRVRVDRSVDVIGHLLFGKDVAPKLVNVIRSPEQPIVDDWDCLKSTVILLLFLQKQIDIPICIIFLLRIRMESTLAVVLFVG